MEIKKQSHFKDKTADRAYFEGWVKKLEAQNGREYERYTLETSLGKTHVWGLNTAQKEAETLVIFPGARTTALIWDFDQGLSNLRHKLRIFLVETNGLPNLSDGASPDIKSLDYGHWATEVLEELNIQQAYIAGASFGGLIAMKLGIVSPEKVKAAFLLNPGCLQPFSLKLKNLYLNLLPIFSPSVKNVRKFLDEAVFSGPTHKLSPQAEELLIDYQLFALRKYKDKTQKPYYMDQQLKQVQVETYLLLGDQDPLFPFGQSAENAKKHIPKLKETKVFAGVGHGIETYEQAIRYLGDKIADLSGSPD